MGYAVGNLCYDNRQQAEDVYYSKVVPYVDGKALYQPIRQADGWYFQGTKLQAALPSCDPAQNFRDGVQLGLYLMIPLVFAWGVVIIRRILR